MIILDIRLRGRKDYDIIKILQEYPPREIIRQSVLYYLKKSNLTINMRNYPYEKTDKEPRLEVKVSISPEDKLLYEFFEKIEPYYRTATIKILIRHAMSEPYLDAMVAVSRKENGVILDMDSPAVNIWQR